MEHLDGYGPYSVHVAEFRIQLAEQYSYGTNAIHCEIHVADNATLNIDASPESMMFLEQEHMCGHRLFIVKDVKADAESLEFRLQTRIFSNQEDPRKLLTLQYRPDTVASGLRIRRNSELRKAEFGEKIFRRLR